VRQLSLATTAPRAVKKKQPLRMRFIAILALAVAVTCAGPHHHYHHWHGDDPDVDPTMWELMAYGNYETEHGTFHVPWGSSTNLDAIFVDDDGHQHPNDEWSTDHRLHKYNNTYTLGDVRDSGEFVMCIYPHDEHCDDNVFCTVDVCTPAHTCEHFLLPMCYARDLTLAMLIVICVLIGLLALVLLVVAYFMMRPRRFSSLQLRVLSN
jgi:hypothetical protein